MASPPATTPSGRASLSALEVLLLLGVVALARALASGSCHIYDDAFISYRYARNLARGAGLVYNPGAPWEPILGTTTPGYAVLVAALMRSGWGAVSASLTLNVAADVTSAWFLVQLARRQRVPATLAVLGLASMPEMARISMGGMEAPVLCMLALGATLELERRRPGRSGVLAALACTVRPEAVLLVGVLFLSAWRSKRRPWTFLVPVALVGVAYAGALTAFYGTPIPHSVVSKSQVHQGKPFGPTTIGILRQAFLPRAAYLPLLPVAIFGLWRVLRTSDPLRPFVLFGLAIVASYVAARPHTWGWYYYVPLMTWVLGLVRGLEPALAALARRVPSAATLTRALGVPLASAVVVAAVGLAASRIEDEVTPRVYEAMARWASEQDFATSGASLLASDIGAIGYYGGGRILDSEGLTWPAALEGGTQMDLVEAFDPDYLLITAVQPRVRPMREREAIVRAYYPVERFSARGATELEPDVDELPPEWVQDYLLYRRRW